MEKFTASMCGIRHFVKNAKPT